MRIQFGRPMLSFYGDPIEEDDPRASLPSTLCEDASRALAAAGRADLAGEISALTRPKKTVTLGDLACRALNAGVTNDSKLDVKQYEVRWELIRSIIRAEKNLAPLDLNAKDVTLIQECIAKAGFPVWVGGQAIAMLEGRCGDDLGELPVPEEAEQPASNKSSKKSSK